MRAHDRGGRRAVRQVARDAEFSLTPAAASNDTTALRLAALLAAAIVEKAVDLCDMAFEEFPDGCEPRPLPPDTLSCRAVPTLAPTPT